MNPTGTDTGDSALLHELGPVGALDQRAEFGANLVLARASNFMVEYFDWRKSSGVSRNAKRYDVSAAS